VTAWEYRCLRGRVEEISPLLARLATLPCPVQLVRADRICGPDHLAHAVRLAARAQAQGRGASDALPAEVVRYLAGERQITKALAKVGIAPGADVRIAALAFGERAKEALDRLATAERWADDPEPLRATREGLLALGVSPEELILLPEARWEDLALERAALVDVAK